MITETARLLRQRMTEAEAAFWEVVRGRRFHGLKFLRQHPIWFEYEGRERFFVADFFCFERRAVIEIDGGIHERQVEYDELRTYIINHLGIRVIRFRNEDVLNRSEEVLKELKRRLTP